MFISSFLLSTGGQGSEQRHFNSQAEGQDSLMQTVVHDYNNKSKSKKQFQRGVRIGFLPATLIAVAQSLSWGYSQAVSQSCSHLKAGEFASKVHLHGCWQDSVPHSPFAGDLSPLPHGPLHRWTAYPHNTVVDFFESKWSKREWDSGQKGSHKSFYSLTSEVASFYMSHILFIRSKSVGPTHVQERGPMYALKCKEVGIIQGFI